MFERVWLILSPFPRDFFDELVDFAICSRIKKGGQGMRCMMGWVAAMSESAIWLLCQYKAYFWQVVITKSRILEVIVCNRTFY